MIKWPELVVQSWGELQDAIDPIALSCVFRGQGKKEWPLISSFGRVVGDADPATAVQMEREAILMFRSEAHLHLNPSVLPPDVFKLDKLDTFLEWLMLMQHHGAPTRLLDWTQSPYVAIYFAVIDDWDSDAAIWYLNGRRVVETSSKHHGVEMVREWDYCTLPADLMTTTTGKPTLYIAMKKMRTAREVAQQGLFTFTDQLMTDHQDAIAGTCEGCEFGRIIIPKEFKPEFTQRLGLMNVTAAALFPGVDGVCDAIRDRLRLSIAFSQPVTEFVPGVPTEAEGSESGQ